MAIVAAILNLILPGFGTLLAACADQQNVSKTQMAIALVQFLTTFFLIGFLFAQYWSYLIVTKSMEDQNSVNRFAEQNLDSKAGASMGSGNGRGGPSMPGGGLGGMGGRS